MSVTSDALTTFLTEDTEYHRDHKERIICVFSRVSDRHRPGQIDCNVERRSKNATKQPEKDLFSVYSVALSALCEKRG
jgi:hypothetical protein